MPEVTSDPSQPGRPAGDSAGRSRGRWRRAGRLAGRVLLVVLLATACSLLALEAADPLARPQACTMCHEMQDVHDKWQQSAHYVNPNGVVVTCTSCHLPPREDYVAHVTSKFWLGAAHAAVHFFGEYDADEARQKVLRTMPNRRCVNCHDNLPGPDKAASRAVGVVHASSVARSDTRDHACVTCHDALHETRPAPAPKQRHDPADNSYCYVCHLNFDGEEFVGQHKAAGVGCTACHGDSESHADDENHTVSPDRMYSKAQVNASCTAAKCHSEDEMEAEIGHRPLNAGAEPDRKHCTDCHGLHRIEKRKRKWDKTTGKLLWPKIVPTTEPGMSGMSDMSGP